MISITLVFTAAEQTWLLRSMNLSARWQLGAIKAAAAMWLLTLDLYLHNNQRSPHLLRVFTVVHKIIGVRIEESLEENRRVVMWCYVMRWEARERESCSALLCYWSLFALLVRALFISNTVTYSTVPYSLKKIPGEQEHGTRNTENIKNGTQITENFFHFSKDYMGVNSSK